MPKRKRNVYNFKYFNVNWVKVMVVKMLVFFFYFNSDKHQCTNTCKQYLACCIYVNKNKNVLLSIMVPWGADNSGKWLECVQQYEFLALRYYTIKC